MARQSESSASRTGREIVYYFGPGILVTSRCVETGYGRFPVPELARVYRQYEETHLARTIACCCGGLELVLAAPLAATYSAFVLLGAALLAAGGLGIAAAVDSRHNPSWMVLVARHRGRLVTLYRTADRQEFGKVQRAVLRAVEANERPEWLAGTDLTVAADPRARFAASPARPRRSGRTSAGPA